VQRTVRLKLQPTPDQTEALRETTAQFTASFNRVCATGWRLQEGNAYTLHRLTYRDCKNHAPALVSDLHVQARQKAAEALKAAIALAKKGKKVGGPHSIACPPRFNRHTYRLDWERASIRLSTTRGRINVPFCLPRYAADAVGCPVATADLIEKKGRSICTSSSPSPTCPWWKPEPPSASIWASLARRSSAMAGSSARSIGAKL
jgi:putative transposase